MKNLTQRIFAAGFLVALASCGSTQQVAIHTTEPSPVVLTNTIKTIGILKGIDQETSKEYRTGIDRLIGVEDQWLVEKGTDAALYGLLEELQKDDRFETVNLLDSIPDSLRDFATDATSISWNKIESICDLYGLDAIFSLSYFDAETQVSFKKTKMLETNMMRVQEEVAAQEITLETLIENGWRIYDPYSKIVVDEFTFNEQFVSSAKGVDAVAALRAIKSRKDSMLSSGKRAGSSYGLRLQPYKRNVSRDYYVKGTERFVAAKDNMDAGDVEGATKLWQQEIENPKAKIKGRACHNMAVSSEIAGDLEAALEWASKAHDNLKSKNAMAYVEELEHRIAQQGILQAQLAHNSFAD